MGLFNRKPKVQNGIHTIVLGEDRTLAHLGMESTGVYVLNKDNRLGYDSAPEATGMLVQVTNGVTKHLGQCCALFEPMARPLNLVTGDWMPKEDEDKKKEVVMDTALTEGASLAMQDMQSEDRFQRMSTILLLLVALFAILALLWAGQSGFLGNLFGGKG